MMEALDDLVVASRRGWAPNLNRSLGTRRHHERTDQLTRFDVAKDAPGLVSITFSRIGAVVTALLTFSGDFTIATKGATGEEWFAEALRWRVSTEEWLWLLGREDAAEHEDALKQAIVRLLDHLIYLVCSVNESAGVLALQ